MSVTDKNIVILGSQGMLGQMVYRYFTAAGFAVSRFDMRYTPDTRVAYTDELRKLRNAIVVNCTGKIKQRTTEAYDLLLVNAVLPTDLRAALHPDVILIHPSTDCVFNADKGTPYAVDDICDAKDDYGWSKLLAEVALAGRANTLIPRVSIIGPDDRPTGMGLLAWTFSQKGKTVRGFSNHYWNGITTLEWCVQIEKFLREHQTFAFTIRQYGTEEYYTKYQMLGLFNDVFDLQLTIEEFNTDAAVDRRLVPQLVSKPLPEQLAEVKKMWYNG